MMRNIPSIATVLGSLLLATGCPGGDDTAQNDTDTDGNDSSTSNDDDTNPSTLDTTVSSTMTDPATTDPDTTLDPDSSSSEGACEGECATADDCLPGQSCIECLCIGEPIGCEVWAGEGQYADCFVDEDGSVDETVCGGAGACVVDDGMNPSAGVCYFDGCTEVCDCPAPPEGFEGQVECSALLTGDTSQCFIGCGDEGETCPEGMFCVGSTVCMFGDEPDPIPQYGDCLNLDGACEDMGTCVSDMAGSLGWCAATCADADDDASCPAAPKGTATPDCIDISGMGAFFCALNCEEGDCPEGMTCLGGNLPICVWEPIEEPPAPAPGYGDCENNPDTTCLETETCLEDDDGAVCTEAGCTTAADCEAAPATGDAPVTCGDLGDGDTCFLDCSADQTCPDGMECVGSSYCHWPSGGFLLDEDFEEGTFVPGWSVVDGDGFAHAMQVDFIAGAWSVESQLEAAGNFAAYSSSYYTPAGTSDDWMITPQLTPSATSELTWDARAQDPDFPDGYEVLLSTMSADPADFTVELFAVDEEVAGAAYTAHNVDLSAYAGMPVYIAFHNGSTDEFVLAVDNVRVTE